LGSLKIAFFSLKRYILVTNPLLKFFKFIYFSRTHNKRKPRFYGQFDLKLILKNLFKRRLKWRDSYESIYLFTFNNLSQQGGGHCGHVSFEYMSIVKWAAKESNLKIDFLPDFFLSKMHFV